MYECCLKRSRGCPGPSGAQRLPFVALVASVQLACSLGRYQVRRFVQQSEPLEHMRSRQPSQAQPTPGGPRPHRWGADGCWQIEMRGPALAWVGTCVPRARSPRKGSGFGFRGSGHYGDPVDVFLPDPEHMHNQVESGIGGSKGWPMTFQPPPPPPPEPSSCSNLSLVYTAKRLD